MLPRRKVADELPPDRTNREIYGMTFGDAGVIYE